MSNYEKLFQLDGKVALITGAAQGIGAEVAVALGELGAKVVISDRDHEQGERRAAEFQSKGIDARFVKLDVTCESDWQDAIKTIEKHYDRLDILVNNAGILFYESVEEMTLEKFRLIQTVNVDGVFLGCKYAIGLMKKHATPDNRASIINLSSMSGIFGTSLMSAYCTSKGAVRLMTKSMAAEFSDVHVRVNSIHPGLIQTDMANVVHDMFKQKMGFTDTDESESLGTDLAPLKAWGTASDVAAAIVFMASNASNFMTATEIVVDGGISGCV